MRNLTHILIAIFYLLLFTFNSFAQSVGINNAGTAPDESALLDLNSTNKGFLITRVNTAAIASPAFGLMTLAPTDSCLYLYNGTKWMGVGGAGGNCICGEAIAGGNPPQSTCSKSFTDTRDGQTYGAVQIGDQCWMSENLNYTPSSGNSWCYDYDPNKCNTLGRHYDWNTAMNGASSSNTNPSGVQGVCPDGWHFPSDEEWKEMEIFNGLSPTEADNTGWRGSNEGETLKTQSWGGNNSSGFTALPSGRRDMANGQFNQEGAEGFWWTSTENTANAWRRSLRDTESKIYRYYVIKGYGFSVRCIKD